MKRNRRQFLKQTALVAARGLLPAAGFHRLQKRTIGPYGRIVGHRSNRSCVSDYRIGCTTGRWQHRWTSSRHATGRGQSSREPFDGVAFSRLIPRRVARRLLSVTRQVT